MSVETRRDQIIDPSKFHIHEHSGKQMVAAEPQLLVNSKLL